MLIKLLKNPFLFVLNVSLVLLAAALFFPAQVVDRPLSPLPTDLAPILDSAAKKDFRTNRKSYIEAMHRAEPDTDWKKIELINRLEKHYAYRKSKPFQKSADIEIIPNVLHASWKELGSNNLAGRMLFAEIDWQDSTLYAASEGGNIWYKPVYGGEWDVINDHFQIEHIIYLKSFRKGNLHRIFAVDSQPWLYYSDDFGQTWTYSAGFEGPQNWGGFRKAALTNDTLPVFYVLAKEWNYTLWTQSLSIYQSKNDGISFQSIYSANLASEASDLWSHPRLNSGVFFIQQNEVYKVENDSLVFISSLNSGISPDEVYLSGYFDGSTTHLFAGLYKAGQTTFFQSIDAGITWTQAGNLSTSTFMENSFYVSQLSPGKLFFGGVECYQSNDYGQNWTKINTWGEYYANPSSRLHADIPAIQSFISPSGSETYYISTDGGLYTAANPLSGVTNISLDGLRVSQYYSIYSNRVTPDDIYAGSQDQGFQKSLPSQGLWIDFDQTISGDYGHLVSGDEGYSIWTVYPSFLMYYPQINQNLEASYFSFQGSNYLWMPPLCEHPYQANKVYLGGGGLDGGAHLFEFTYGNGINQVEHPFDFSGGTNNVKIAAIAYSVLNPQYRYVATNDGQFYYSSNEGISWTKTSAFSGPDGHYFYGSDILTTQKDESIVYLAGSGYSNPPVYKSIDYGQSFSPMRTGLPSTLVYGLAANTNGSLIFAATEAGPYLFIDSLNRWFDLSMGAAPDQVYWSVEYIDSLNAVRFGTHGRGIWQCSIQELISIAQEPMSHLKYSLYPNPASEFLIVECPDFSGVTQLEVYDIQGREVLQQSSFASESIRLEINYLNPGIYWIKIKTGKTSSVGKFVKK
jgi:hypothetical protein